MHIHLLFCENVELFRFLGGNSFYCLFLFSFGPFLMFHLPACDI
jgi:hypothetical protein